MVGLRYEDRGFKIQVRVPVFFFNFSAILILLIQLSLKLRLHSSITFIGTVKVWFTEFRVSCVPVHRRRDETVELRRVGVGGVYWALVWTHKQFASRKARSTETLVAAVDPATRISFLFTRCRYLLTCIIARLLSFLSGGPDHMITLVKTPHPVQAVNCTLTYIEKKQTNEIYQ